MYHSTPNILSKNYNSTNLHTLNFDDDDDDDDSDSRAKTIHTLNYLTIIRRLYRLMALYYM
jgi:hypothetical protein